jgi:hypothetical protein
MYGILHRAESGKDSSDAETEVLLASADAVVVDPEGKHFMFTVEVHWRCVWSS